MTRAGTKQRTMSPLMLRLTTLWQTRSAERFGGYEKPLTDKEFGQLAYVRKCLRDRTYDVAAYALDHWITFAYRAGIEAGVTHPAEPNIAFFVKHHPVAVTMLQRSIARPPSPKPIPKPIPPSLPQTPIEVPHYLTLQELEQMKADLKE